MNNSIIYKIGLIGETIFTKYLSIYKSIEIVKNNDNNEYDLIDTSNIKYEIKFDLQAFKTGNIFIEYESFSKPSGICTTLSDVYVFVVPNLTVLDVQIFQVQTNVLKAYISANQLPKKSSIAKNASDIVTKFVNRGYIMKISELKTIACDTYLICETDEHYKNFIEHLEVFN